MACQSKVVGYFLKKYKTPKDAELHYFMGDTPQFTQTSSTPRSFVSASMQTDDIDALCLLALFKKLPAEEQLQALSMMFIAYMSSSPCITVPEDFLIHAKNAMLQLRNSGRSNVLYNLAKGLGTIREDSSDSRFPTKCMPMGLVEYAASFFVCDNLQKVWKR